MFWGGHGWVEVGRRSGSLVSDFSLSPAWPTLGCASTFERYCQSQQPTFILAASYRTWGRENTPPDQSHIPARKVFFESLWACFAPHTVTITATTPGAANFSCEGPAGVLNSADHTGALLQQFSSVAVVNPALDNTSTDQPGHGLRNLDLCTPKPEFHNFHMW